QGLRRNPLPTEPRRRAHRTASPAASELPPRSVRAGVRQADGGVAGASAGGAGGGSRPSGGAGRPPLPGGPSPPARRMERHRHGTSRRTGPGPVRAAGGAGSGGHGGGVRGGGGVVRGAERAGEPACAAADVAWGGAGAGGGVDAA